jgi:ABC-type glycerol-3-phosphate transport system substrate-binding protein
MRRTTIALLATTALTLTACSASSDTDQPKTTTTVTATATKTPQLSTAQQRQACVDAWAETIGSRPADFDPDVDTDTEPTECAGLPEGDYTDMYMEGLQQQNQAGRDDAEDCLSDPTCTSLPIP